MVDTTQLHDAALDRLRAQLLTRWQDFTDNEALDALLIEALAAATVAPAEMITVSSPVSRVTRLQLAPIAESASLDSFYHGESAGLSISHTGRCYLVYRRSDGGDYAVEWSTATLMPEALMRGLPAVLALALLEDDGHV
ncbi:MAG: hypothetical protein HOI95_11140 [Chromatiales bacterium]|jgi:hypothetical protein|nr:hypothetical protein [Chromatiales bacterium]